MNTFSARHRRTLSSAALVAAVAISGCASLAPDPTEPGDGEPVSIGYGTQDRADVTGAVSSVNAEDLEGQQVTSFEDLINGRFPGVYVQRLNNGGISIRIRGANSLLGDGEPLYVIDGLTVTGPAGSALMAVNPNEVARIDILKDAGSTAIYGSRGANGVVLITTKRGS